MLRILFCGFFLMSITGSLAQESVNDYKYVVVPQGYSFLKQNDKYQLNSLTKFLFNKYGFRAFMQGDKLPEDLISNGCKALQASVTKNSGLFVTKLMITLTDCNGNDVFKSSDGISREKEFKKAYHEALRDAFNDVKALNYSYKNNKEAIEKKSDTVAKSIVEEESIKKEETQEVKKEPVEVVAPKDKTILYQFNKESYTLKSEEYGYELLKIHNNTSVSLGNIYKMNKDNSYLIDAGVLSGGGYFDGYGNFIIERINPATKKIIIDTLARQ